MGLSLNCLFSCLRVLKYIVQFSSLDPIFFFGIWEVLTSHHSVLFLSHLIKCGLDLDTVHLALRYSLSIVHLFMVCGTSRLTPKVQPHLCLSAYCPMFTLSVHFNCSGFLSFNVHGSSSLFTRLISPFCPIYFTFIGCIIHL